LTKTNLRNSTHQAAMDAARCTLRLTWRRTAHTCVKLTSNGKLYLRVIWSSSSVLTRIFLHPISTFFSNSDDTPTRLGLWGGGRCCSPPAIEGGSAVVGRSDGGGGWRGSEGATDRWLGPGLGRGVTAMIARSDGGQGRCGC
jgi:hypothetical protein